MRIQSSNTNGCNEFKQWVMNIENGVDCSDDNTMVTLPSNIVLQRSSLKDLVHWVYSELAITTTYASYFSKRAILAPINS